MLDCLAFEFDNSKSGMVTLVYGGYHPSIGWSACKTGQNPPVAVWRTFMSFDTSTFPAHAQIESVTFRIRRTEDFIGTPEIYALKFSLGTFIGAALDGNVGEWDGGTHLLTLDAKPGDRDVVNFADDGGDPCPLINRSGDTDVKIWDDSYQGSGAPSWTTNFNKSTTERCKLYLNYSVPSATLTGVGTLSCAAMVVSLGTATLTGVGTLSCAAMVVSLGTATLTGVGTLSCAAMVVSLGTATLTGVGTLTCTAVMINLNVMAQHAATRSVSGSHSSSVAVSSVHSASVSCDPEDAGERGARRVTDE